MIGGLNAEPSQCGEQFADGEWKSMPPMQTARFLPAAASLEDVLYVAGGQTKDTVCASVERFERCQGKHRWSSLAPMQTARRNFAMTATPTGLIVTGGVGRGYERLASVECYAEKRWTAPAPMLYCRHGHQLVSLNRYVDAIGGIRGEQERRHAHEECGVERYDFASNCWTLVQSMHRKRVFSGACVFGGEIYVFGGRSAPDSGCRS